jgi:hypothetical protein
VSQNLKTIVVKDKYGRFFKSLSTGARNRCSSQKKERLDKNNDRCLVAGCSEYAGNLKAVLAEATDSARDF